jgi:hypothetical protein
MTASQNTVKIYRITFCANIGSIPVAGDLDIQTKKETWEIDHEAIVEKMLKEQSGGYATLSRIVDSVRIK